MISISARRILCAAILGICALGASASVAQAAARLDHACCHRAAPADSLTAPEAPCDGFLPLTCCHAAALPGGDHASLRVPTVFALISTASLAAAPTAALSSAGDATLAPRIAATRFTVVRQL